MTSSPYSSNIVSTLGVSRLRSALSQLESVRLLLVQCELAVESSARSLDVQLTSLGPSEDGVLVSRKHVETMVQSHLSVVDVIPFGEGVGSGSTGIRRPST